MNQMIEQSTSACVAYNEQGEGLLPVKAPLASTAIPPKPWGLIGYDLIELLPTSQGNVFALTMVDYFTKFRVAFPLPDKMAETVVAKIVHVYSLFGVPDYIIYDNGTEFKNQINRSVEEALRIKHRYAKARQAPTCGQVEQINKQLKTDLTQYCCERGGEWDAWVDAVVLAANATVHSSTKYSPFELMFRRQPHRLAACEGEDYVYDGFDIWDEEKLQREYASIAREKLETDQQLFANVAENIEAAQSRQQRPHHNTEKHVKELEFGASVFVCATTAPKGEPQSKNFRKAKYCGPFNVLAVQGSDQPVKRDAGSIKVRHQKITKSKSTRRFLSMTRPAKQRRIPQNVPIATTASVLDTVVQNQHTQLQPLPVAKPKATALKRYVAAQPVTEVGDVSVKTPGACSPSEINSMLEGLSALGRVFTKDAVDMLELDLTGLLAKCVTDVSSTKGTLAVKDVLPSLKLLSATAKRSMLYDTIGNLPLTLIECISNDAWCLVKESLKTRARISKDERKKEKCMDSAVVWIRISVPQELTLTFEDWHAINEDAGWLTEAVVQAAQLLLRNQFPKLLGMEDPLCFSVPQSNTSREVALTATVNGMRKKWSASRNPNDVAVRKSQILFVNGNHWIMVTNEHDGPAEHIFIYDTLRPSTDRIFEQEVALVFRIQCSDQLKYIWPSIAKQKNGNDCGLLAIANLTEKCFGGDPAAKWFKKTELRPHLTSCLRQKNLLPFPSSERQPDRRLKEITVKILCDCRAPVLYDAESKWECSKCSRLFHRSCMTSREAILPSEIRAPPAWLCRTCKKSDGTNNASGSSAAAAIDGPDIITPSQSDRIQRIVTKRRKFSISEDPTGDHQ